MFKRFYLDMKNDEFSTSLREKLIKVDVFPKIPQKLSHKSRFGGLMSLLTIALILFFTIKETKQYFFPSYMAKISIAKPLSFQKMIINLDIEFPSTPCELLAIDSQDIIISYQSNIQNIQKWVIDRNGNYVKKSSNYSIITQNFDAWASELSQSLRNQYGCRFKGLFFVQEVSGNFHVSYHSYFYFWHQYTQKKGIDFKNINMSHKIHKLYLGSQENLFLVELNHPEAILQSLNGKSANISLQESSVYHIDIIPTVYLQNSRKSGISTYQYTYKYNQYRKIDENIPNIVNFNYVVHGISAEIIPLTLNFLNFILRLCAVIGGIYALAKALNNIFPTIPQRKLIQKQNMEEIQIQIIKEAGIKIMTEKNTEQNIQMSDSSIQKE